MKCLICEGPAPSADHGLEMQHYCCYECFRGADMPSVLEMRLTQEWKKMTPQERQKWIKEEIDLKS